ncbi:MerR family transcriptional regulator [Polyangium mundeleinium]|uniref:MerR family transcriptional regulator n=1 Tax=Polyangium mundeleinium TaxID=2995306 RepID=A0ABT5EDJ4_9BACT|nr:MerR family transcriptional regulator [Polyangium mundeleinium]MDC0739892.1 MerR family transcriptional regulator [Polyangium mundeleinium]
MESDPLSLYRIRTVSELTGVSSATLRAWERRYGVPAPSRTSSAYRLYSEEDVALIVKMRDLVKAGMAPAESARLLLSEPAIVAAPTAPPPGAAPLDTDPFTVAKDRIVETTRRFDPDGLEEEVSKTLTLGPAVAIFDRTIGPALREIGDLWHAGTITVAQEHLASNVLGGTLIHLLRLAQPADATRRVALACFADEDHVLGLYGAGLRFTSWGFRTLMIGARTPPPAIARVVDSLAPDLVGLSVTMAVPPPRARELVDAYADACRGVAWLVGGDGSEAMRAWVEDRGGICVGRDLAAARQTIERVLAAQKRRRPSRGSKE